MEAAKKGKTGKVLEVIDGLWYGLGNAVRNRSSQQVHAAVTLIKLTFLFFFCLSQISL